MNKWSEFYHRGEEIKDALYEQYHLLYELERERDRFLKETIEEEKEMNKSTYSKQKDDCSIEFAVWLDCTDIFENFFEEELKIDLYEKGKKKTKWIYYISKT